MRWITRERPKIDRVACPWLIRRFIDREAEFLFVPAAEVTRVATERGATPYDVEGVELSHDGPLCSFDAFLAKYALDDPALAVLATIVRGADTARLDLALLKSVREAGGVQTYRHWREQPGAGPLPKAKLVDLAGASAEVAA